MLVWVRVSNICVKSSPEDCVLISCSASAPKPNRGYLAFPLNGRAKNTILPKASVPFQLFFLWIRRNDIIQPRSNADNFVWQYCLKWSSEQISHWTFTDLMSARWDIVEIGSLRSARRWLCWLWNHCDTSSMTRRGYCCMKMLFETLNRTEVTYEVFPFLESALKYRQCSAAEGHENRCLFCGECWTAISLVLQTRLTPTEQHLASPLNGRVKNAVLWEASVP